MIPWYFFVKTDFFTILWTLKKWLFWYLYQCAQNSFHEQVFLFATFTDVTRVRHLRTVSHLYKYTQISLLMIGFTSLRDFQMFQKLFPYKWLHLFATFTDVPRILSLRAASPFYYLYGCTQSSLLTGGFTYLLTVPRLLHLRTALPLSTNNNFILLDIRMRLPPPYLK